MLFERCFESKTGSLKYLKILTDTEVIRSTDRGGAVELFEKEDGAPR